MHQTNNRVRPNDWAGLSYEPDQALRSQVAQQGRGAADCGEYRQAAGAVRPQRLDCSRLPLSAIWSRLNSFGDNNSCWSGLKISIRGSNAKALGGWKLRRERLLRPCELPYASSNDGKTSSRVLISSMGATSVSK